jgi:hypothetical protein
MRAAGSHIVTLAMSCFVPEPRFLITGLYNLLCFDIYLSHSRESRGHVEYLRTSLA